MDIPGFNLLLQDFCDYCPDFKAEVETIEGGAISEGVPRAYHNIRCSHAKCCARIAKNISKRVMANAEKD